MLTSYEVSDVVQRQNDVSTSFKTFTEQHSTTTYTKFHPPKTCPADGGRTQHIVSMSSGTNNPPFSARLLTTRPAAANRITSGLSPQNFLATPPFYSRSSAATAAHAQQPMGSARLAQTPRIFQQGLLPTESSRASAFHPQAPYRVVESEDLLIQGVGVEDEDVPSVRPSVVSRADVVLHRADESDRAHAAPSAAPAAGDGAADGAEEEREDLMEQMMLDRRGEDIMLRRGGFSGFEEDGRPSSTEKQASQNAGSVPAGTGRGPAALQVPQQARPPRGVMMGAPAGRRSVPAAVLPGRRWGARGDGGGGGGGSTTQQGSGGRTTTAPKASLLKKRPDLSKVHLHNVPAPEPIPKRLPAVTLFSAAAAENTFLQRLFGLGETKNSGEGLPAVENQNPLDGGSVATEPGPAARISGEASSFEGVAGALMW